VGFTQPADTQFTVAWTGSPSMSILAPGASLPGLVGQVQADRPPRPRRAAPRIKVTGALCGTQTPASVALSGQGSNGSVGVQRARSTLAR